MVDAEKRFLIAPDIVESVVILNAEYVALKIDGPLFREKHAKSVMQKD